MNPLHRATASTRSDQVLGRITLVTAATDAIGAEIIRRWCRAYVCRRSVERRRSHNQWCLLANDGCCLDAHDRESASECERESE